jgi:hypothetical protein
MCEGFRTTARYGRCRLRRGRRRKASREGTRGKLRWAESRYGDLVRTVRFLEGAEAQDLRDCGRWFGWRALMKRGGGRVSALHAVSNAMAGTHQATR